MMLNFLGLLLIETGVSVQFLMVGEINSMVGYHLINLARVWGMCEPQQVQGSVLIITIILILMIIFLEFLIKWLLIKKQCLCQTYDMKYLNAAGQ